jgi:dihydrolipoamide dehydrogenase
MLPGVTVSQNVVTYEEQILDENLPGSIIIAGSGAIGVEFAYVMKNFGVDVTIVEFLDRMVPTEDADVSKELAKHYKKLGVKVMLGTKVESVEDTGSGVRVTVSPAPAATSRCSRPTSCSRRSASRPRTRATAWSPPASPVTERGAIEIDDYCRTNVPNVYAIGDCTAKMMLAHVAEAMGIVAAETIAGAETMPIDYDFIPRATYCHPQIGSFGYSEAQAKEKGYDVKTATFPFTANGKAGPRRRRRLRQGRRRREAQRDPRRPHDRPGRHRAAARADPRQKWDLTADEVARNVFAHPTLSEAVKEAVEGIVGHMINF